MHGLADFLFYALAGCFAVAFLIELALNRRPWVVGFITPVAGYVAFLIAATAVFGPVDGASALLFGAIFLHGIIASLAGAGAARGLRMWISYFREESGS